MEDQDQRKPRRTPRVETYTSESGEDSGPGSMRTFSFGSLKGASDEEVASIMQTISRLIEEHGSPGEIIYTTATGHTADGLPYAEATLLPVGDTLRLTLGDSNGQGAIGTNATQMRRIIIYMLASYLALVYEVDVMDIQSLCDMADEQAEREEAREAEGLNP